MTSITTFNCDANNYCQLHLDELEGKCFAIDTSVTPYKVTTNDCNSMDDEQFFLFTPEGKLVSKKFNDQCVTYDISKTLILDKCENVTINWGIQATIHPSLKPIKKEDDTTKEDHPKIDPLPPNYSPSQLSATSTQNSNSELPYQIFIICAIIGVCILFLIMFIYSINHK